MDSNCLESNTVLAQIVPDVGRIWADTMFLYGVKICNILGFHQAYISMLFD